MSLSPRNRGMKLAQKSHPSGSLKVGWDKPLCVDSLESVPTDCILVAFVFTVNPDKTLSMVLWLNQTFFLSSSIQFSCEYSPGPAKSVQIVPTARCALPRCVCW